MARATRTYGSRNVEFLKFAPPGIEYRRNCVLESDWFGEVVVDEGPTTVKKIARKGQILVRDPSTRKYRPYAATQLSADAASGDSSIVVNDASGFVAGQTLTVDGGASKTISSVNYSTNTIVLTATVGAAVSADDAVVGTTYTGASVAPGDMVVNGYEVDLTYGDEPAVGYFLHCIFNPDGLYGYAGNESAVETAMPTCLFDE